MRRRDLLRALGGAAAWPVAARAQQAERVRRIAVLIGGDENEPLAQARAKALQRGLQELGWLNGRNIRIDHRFGGSSSAERARVLVQELLDLQPELIAVQGNLPLRIVTQATSSVPTVFANVFDPVSDGFVASLAHPGGNVTGFAMYEYTMSRKWLGLLKEIAPTVTRVAVLLNAANPASINHLQTVETAAPALGLQITALRLRNSSEVAPAMAAFAGGANHGLIALPGVTNVMDVKDIIDVAAHHRLPAVYPARFLSKWAA